MKNNYSLRLRDYECVNNDMPCINKISVYSAILSPIFYVNWCGWFAYAAEAKGTERNGERGK